MIDWHEQWQAHSPVFKDGFVQLVYGNSTMKLAPGPGFGDFSHPTTRLTLSLMEPYVLQKSVLDMGCGSGILSIASLLMGAERCHGVDIDPEAVSHAAQNGAINGLSCSFSLASKNYPVSDILVMNMIRSEQAIARPEGHFEHIFTSGVLEEERELYLAQTRAWGWTLVETRQESNWLGFHFKS